MTLGDKSNETYVYVSGIVKNVRIKQAPEKNVKSQNIQTHETPATAIHPLTIGANDGPAKGARVNMATALPRVFGSHMSEITALRGYDKVSYLQKHRQITNISCTHPLFVSGAAANTPPRKRNTRIEAVLRESAHPT